jgi:hypothetical protein
VTRHHYERDLGISLMKSRLVATDDAVRGADDRQVTDAAVLAVFASRVSATRPLRLAVDEDVTIDARRHAMAVAYLERATPALGTPPHVRERISALRRGSTDARLALLELYWACLTLIAPLVSDAETMTTEDATRCGAWRSSACSRGKERLHVHVNGKTQSASLEIHPDGRGTGVFRL